MTGKYICFNEELLKSSEPTIHVNNRALNYGDGIFETIRCLNSQPLFFEEHYKRIVNSLVVLKINLPEEFTDLFFKRQIYKLLQRNRIYKGARVRLTLFRNPGGLYTPTNNTCSFIIVSQSLQEEHFSLRSIGLNIGIYTSAKKSLGMFSSLKSCNSLLFVMAGIYRAENNYDECLLLNENEKIIESLSSNIFLVKDTTIYTPSLKSGCVDGTMRRTLLKIACSQNFLIKEVDGFSEDDLFEADEVFLTNAVQGIAYFTGYKGKRYYHLVCSKLLAQLNSSIKSVGL